MYLLKLSEKIRKVHVEKIVLLMVQAAILQLYEYRAIHMFFLILVTSDLAHLLIQKSVFPK